MKKRKAMLIREESLCLMPYYCSNGHLTIGVGHNMEANPLPPEMRELVDKKLPITEKMALDLLDQDDAKFEAQAKTFPWFDDLTEDRQDVIVMMIFQMGLSGVKEFKGMIVALEKGDTTEAANQMLDSKWARNDSPARAKRLAKMMKEG